MGGISQFASGTRAGYGGPDQKPRVLGVLSSLLQRMVDVNDKCAIVHDTDRVRTATTTKMQDWFTVFHGRSAPPISIEEYVERIFKYANCSPSCFVVAYAYLDRIIHQPAGGIPITSLNVHRLLITSVMVAAKFLDDSFYNNAYYGKVGGVSTQEINRLELEFLFGIGFRLHVSLQEFDCYCSRLERELISFDMERALTVPSTAYDESPGQRVQPSSASSYQQIILESVS
ncbi:hypothetical protein KP509_18G057900 [Ceratopteris richardii]|uniref:Cyclin n=1 Tax=Ceratopteris richardii TaxID=49495 RepID=A0A8T2SS19_CERRI|nr:hypothetical protein KP509_18G057900 [Ceratopteris richardii]